MQRAYMDAAAMALSKSEGPIPSMWFEAMATTKEEADEMQFSTNAERMTQVARMSRGRH